MASLAIDQDKGVRSALPGVSTQPAAVKKKKKKSKKRSKKKNKISAQEVLTRLVGPQRSVSVVPVYIGGADMALPVANLKPIDGVKLRRVAKNRAFPQPHPVRGGAVSTRGATALALQAPASRSREAAAAASLFARSQSPRATGNPAVLLPAQTIKFPRVANGIPIPQPHPRR